ncbi:NAD(P)H-hydrate epimerase, partial [Pseudorhodobacter sp.]|uniref:NAD(P)H-hydrate epimerase n=1 Tax=Pseudorhodobacter sp. TaxID=1934400 RepID=UPI002649B8E8
MTELLTAAQMRAIEQAAIESGQVTGLELMERAGRGVLEAIFDEWPELRATSHRAVVLCGPGNNGGDGFVVARLLKEWGWEVFVFLLGDPANLPPDAKANFDKWQVVGATHVERLDHDDDMSSCFEPALFSKEADLLLGNAYVGHVVIIDALLGIGLNRPMLFAAEYAATISSFVPDDSYDIQFHCVAIDMVSGTCADSGKALRKATPMVGEQLWPLRFEPDLTVTFHRPKLGHMLGADKCGKLAVVDIGLPSISQLSEASVWLSDPNFGTGLKKSFGHKFSHGHALILSGGIATGGAARLAARGALRIGAGV